MVKKTPQSKTELEYSSIRSHRQTYLDFRAVCIAQGVSPAKKIEEMMSAFTQENANSALVSFKKLTKRLKNKKLVEDC